MNATFYHAGCPVCVSVEKNLLHLLDVSKVTVHIVHLGEVPEKISDAEKAGVESVPALVLDGNVLHLNFGASLNDLKQ